MRRPFEAKRRLFVAKFKILLLTLDILAGCLVAKSAINLDAFQLPFRVLVEGADPDIPNALSSHGIPCKMSGKTL
ncbi:hypothetical protein BED04_27740 [Escherichia coli]|nr:hypothetical protein [Escherichia coli]